MNIIGLHILTHNPSGTIITSDNKIYSIALERINRKKNSTGLYSDELIKYLLNSTKLKFDEIDYFIIDKVINFDTKQDLIDRSNFNFKNKQIISINHHLAHAYSTYVSSGFNDCAILIVDGAGEWIKEQNREGVEGTSIYNVINDEIKLIAKSLHFRDKKVGYLNGLSLGKFYSKITKMVGFGKYQEGKLMGLAPYYKGDDLKLSLNKIIKFKDGEIYINQNIFYNQLKSRIKEFFKFFLKNKNFINFYLPIKKPNTDWNNIDKNYIKTAAIAQKIVEVSFKILGEWIIKTTKQKKLCVAGGVALNIDANTVLAEKIGFKETFTLPASEDSGISMGCAYWGKKKFDKKYEKKKIINAYFGKEYSTNEIINALEKSTGIKFYKSTDHFKETAELISIGKVIGWFSGRSEFGPRALGNRSILADPRKEDMKNYINKFIKKRELFRPFAPAVTEEMSNEYFDTQLISPFMLLKANVKEKYRNLIPAVVHADNSARFQTVNKMQNKNFYKLINEFGKITNIYVVLNTSFNGPGEPIVETPDDAIKSFQRLNLDYLILENYIIKKQL